MRLARLPLSLLILVLPPLPGATAAEPHKSANFTHIGNFPYTLRYDSKDSGGTDLEFATLTIAGPTAPPTTPIVTIPGVKKPKAKKKKQTYAACMKKAKKVKNKRKRAAAQKKCRKLKKKAKKSAIDVDGTKAGVQHTYAFLGTYNNGLQIFDISDQDKPVQVGHYDCGISQGDVQIFTRPDLGGRTFVAYAADDGYSFMADSKCATDADALGFDASGKQGSGTFIADVTDPTNPRTVSFVYFAKGSHNQTVHPSGKYLYNSNSDLATDTSPGIEVVDLTDLVKPKDVFVMPITVRPGLGSDSHDISFNADGTRAYSAAVSQGLVIDTTDPTKPKIISSIFDPAVNVWHQAEIITANVPGIGERTILVGSDEFAGAAGTGQCPNGALHMYDITGPLEAAPVKLGTFNIGEARATDAPIANCTSHVFQLHREQNMMIIAWYAAGTRVLDITEAAGVAFGAQGAGFKELGYGWFPDSDVWATKAPFASRDKPFNIYANDHFRGLDVWKFDPTKPAARSGRASKITFTPAALEKPATGGTLARFVCMLEG